MIVGLTGSIGSGKSTASARLASLGAHVLDADEVSHALTAPGGEALGAIAAAFGRDILNAEGTLERRKLAALVFSDADARERLNAILHPLVQQRMRERTEEIFAKDPRAVVVWDVPLLIEAGWQDACDEVWLVSAPIETRVARVVARDACTREEAAARIAAQMSDEEKARHADEIIDNGADIAAFLARVDALYRRVAGAGG
ncbi:MAG TPA: dephospho-CoA kinase [Clostridia bacterium]|nr:dephospho-CoA kinase [Clostridia bacterium]